MGAKQRGQLRGKKAKGSMKGSPVSQKQLNQAIQVPSLDPRSRSKALQGWSSSPGRGSSTAFFSMSQEARNTERHVNGWGSTPLRGNAVAFVSAGYLGRKEGEEEEEEEEEGERDETEDQDTALPSKPEETTEETQGVLRDESSIDDGKAQSEPVPDGLVQEEPLTQPATQMQIPIQPPATTSEITVPIFIDRPSAPLLERSHSMSSSGSDEIVFVGRNASRSVSQKPGLRAAEKETSQQQSIPNKEQVLPAIDPIQKLDVPPFQATKPRPILSGDATPAVVDLSSSLPRSRRRGRKNMRRPRNDEEAILQDYIDNMAMDDSEENIPGNNNKPVRKNEHYRMYHGSGEENAKVKLVSSRPEMVEESRIFDQAADWDSDALQDFDDISTTDEEVDKVGQVLRHRERTAGPQYLVVAPGMGASDAKWLPLEKLMSKSAQEEIRIYEEIRAMQSEDGEDGEDGNDDDDNSDDYEDIEDSSSGDDDEIKAIRDLMEDIESEDDENARIIRHTARMTDEQIARALAKQEELGMGADELVLFGGDIPDSEDFVARDDFELGNDFVRFSTRQHTSNRTRSGHSKKQRDSFPSAEAFADALDQDPYGAFDIMDFDRPSLKPKKKGRKSDYPFDLELEDDDLRDQLVNTWTKDREKKATRKREREEIRLNASLDSADGSDPAVIKLRIRQFLVQEVDVLRLSPMESSTRAGVHRLAKHLGLKSQSEGKEGKGLGRYPVLTKTPKTRSYTLANIYEVDALFNSKKFFPRTAFRSSRKGPSLGTARARRGGGGGGVMSGVSYTVGEVVGASAPEIGSDNKGRAMLEKMGWTAGMGIGAAGKEGNPDFVKHVYKADRYGLG